jgi:hypothetical protein
MSVGPSLLAGLEQRAKNIGGSELESLIDRFVEQLDQVFMLRVFHPLCGAVGSSFYAASFSC